MGSDSGELPRRTLRSSWFGHQSLLVRGRDSVAVGAGIAGFSLSLTLCAMSFPSLPFGVLVPGRGSCREAARGSIRDGDCGLLDPRRRTAPSQRSGAPRHRLHPMRRRVTFSRNLTLSLSRTCRCYCKYCAFATHKAHLYAPEQVLEILDGAARRRVKELLVLTGEHPEVNAQVAERLRSYGHEDFTAYVAWTCERALERGLLPHTNLGVISREELARLREVTASQGLMLESASERLMETVHAGSPTKHPARRLEAIEAAGELRIPFTSGILVGIGEEPQEPLQSLEAIAASHSRHGHIQEVILQNFVPHQSYYGREPAQIADAAAREYWRTGGAQGRPSLELPNWAAP